MHTIALVLGLLLQAGTQKDAVDLQKFLGTDYPGAIRLLVPGNDALLNNFKFVTPTQRDEMRRMMTPPNALPDGQEIFPLTLLNVGKGYVTTLFEVDFPAEQVNLVFCPVKPRIVIAVQVLFDDRYALKDTVWLFQHIYRMPEPVPFETRKPAVKYQLEGVTYDKDGKWTRGAGAPPITVWDLGNVEAVYQPVKNQQFYSGQYWIADKDASTKCKPATTTPAQTP